MQYINVVRTLHLEAGFLNLFHNCWHVYMLLKGIKRALGTSVKQKLTITPHILCKMFTLVDFSRPVDVTFWAAGGLRSFPFSHVKPSSKFFPLRYIQVASSSGSEFFSRLGNSGCFLVKAIQYRQRSLWVALPCILDFSKKNICLFSLGLI